MDTNAFTSSAVVEIIQPIAELAIARPELALALAILACGSVTTCTAIKCFAQCGKALIENWERLNR